MGHHFYQAIKGGYKETQRKDAMSVFCSAYGSHISRLYIGFLRSTSTIYVKHKWEQKGLSLKEEEWESICTIQWQTTTSLKWRECCWKKVICFIITPPQKNGFQRIHLVKDIAVLLMPITIIFFGTVT